MEGWIKENEKLLLILAGAMFLRVPTLFEPYWYGDEGIYLTLGQAINKGLKLYSQIHDNKPPFLYLIAAVAGGGLFWFRFIAAIWNVVTVVVFAKAYRAIFGEKHRLEWGAVVIFALLTNLPTLEGNIANAELFFLLPTLAAVAVLWKKSGMAEVFLGGLLVGLGSLFKIPALLEAGVWTIFWLTEVLQKKMKSKDWLLKSAVLGAGALLPLVLSFGYWGRGEAKIAYLSAILGQNINYLSTWKEGGVFDLKVRVAVAMVILGAIVMSAKKLGGRGVLITVWWVITLFAALLSGRPYPHYLLQMAGAITMGIALMTEGNRWERMVLSALMAILVGAVVGFKFWVYPVAGYYANFLKWATGQQNKQAYFEWFGPTVTRDYQIATLIWAQSKSEERIFVWGDTPMIYALSRRLPATKYTAKYHIESFGAQVQTIKEITTREPKYIVTTDNPENLPGLLHVLNDKYMLEEEIEGARVYRKTVGR